ncbi:Transmembrane protein 41 homolog [Chlamydiales bacterium SCGC AG-110-P3]|nr:Transmembrane protein 41 homolog [Chlamydiales bacterium SCGC AG-110-P3]
MTEKRPFGRFLPLTIIIALMLIGYQIGLGEYLSFESIKTHRNTLQELVSAHPITAPLTYMLVYTLATALSIPGAVFLTLIGGFLFPQPWALIYVVTSATAGAIAIFLAAKTALGTSLRRKAGGLINTMQSGFQNNAVSYLLFLRLVPAFPFWLVNLAPAFFGVSLLTFAWTTFFGIIPGSFVFTQAGAGLGAIFDSGEAFSIDAIFNNDIKVALVALGLFALLPIVVKKIRGERDS